MDLCRTGSDRYGANLVQLGPRDVEESRKSRSAAFEVPRCPGRPLGGASRIGFKRKMQSKKAPFNPKSDFTTMSADYKTDSAHAEAGDGHDKSHLTETEIKHGDNALRYVGEERVELTQEDVSGHSTKSASITYHTVPRMTASAARRTNTS